MEFKRYQSFKFKYFSIEQSISLNGLPEDIITDGKSYASIPHLALYDQGNGTNVVKIDPLTNQITKTYEVGKGPQHLIIHNDNLFISGHIIVKIGTKLFWYCSNKFNY